MVHVVMRHLNSAWPYGLYYLRGVKSATLSQGLGIQGGILQGDGGDEVRLQTGYIPQHAPHTETEQQQQHQDSPLMQQADACGHGVRHGLTHGISTQEKSGRLHLTPPLRPLSLPRRARG